MEWRDASTPPDTHRVVWVKTPSGDERPLRYHNNLWWLPDDSMYVYFTPTHWKDNE